jgi:hypothetical protein
LFLVEFPTRSSFGALWRYPTIVQLQHDNHV